MKHKLCVTLGLILLGLAVPSPTRALDVGVAGFGSYFDADSAGDAWGGGAMVRLGLFDWLAVDARASYLDISDADVELVPLEAAALFRLPLFDQRLVPYGGVGVGYYLFANSDLVKVDDNVGFFPVVGLECHLGEQKNWAIFGEARWLFIYSDIDAANSSLNQLSSDDISGVGVNVGISLSF